MAIQGGVIERKEIGMGIPLVGEFYNTEVINGKLQLKKVNDYYYDNGYFISSVINIGDSFKEFDNIVSTITAPKDGLVIISTKTSDDSVNFTTWEVLDDENKIKSTKKQYIQIRVELFAVKESVNKSLDLDEYITEETNGFLENKKVGSIGYVPLQLTSNAVTDYGFPFGNNALNDTYTYYRVFASTGSFRPLLVNKNDYYLGYNFSSDRKITKYKMTANSPIDTLPVSWILQGSNDTTTGLNGNWVDLHQVTEVTWVTTTETKEFEFNNELPYRAYRIHVIKGGSNTSYNDINKLEFYENEVDILKLKKEFLYEMSNDASWTGEGILYRKEINRDEWLRIDRLEVS